MGVTERSAQAGHQRLQSVRLIARRILTPHCVDERAGADRAPGVEGQPGQQAAQPGAGDIDGHTVDPDFERSEQPDLHASTVAGPWTGSAP